MLPRDNTPLRHIAAISVGGADTTHDEKASHYVNGEITLRHYAATLGGHDIAVCLMSPHINVATIIRQ